MASDRNVFTLGRRLGDEDQLTEYIAWLIGAVPEVGGELLGLAGARPQPAEGWSVATQRNIRGGVLDLLLEAPGQTIVVESKLGSVYGPDQLERYIMWLADERADSERFVLTLTERAAPWPSSAVDLARERGVGRSERRWADLHARLVDLIAAGPLEPASALLVKQFTKMLEAERLIPVPPLTEHDLGAWSAGADAVDRVHRYFAALKPEIANAFGVSPHSNRSSVNTGYAFGAFELPTGWFVYVGIWASSRGWPRRAGAPTGDVPVFGATLCGPGGQSVSVADGLAPPGWFPGAVKAQYSWPGIWRPLADVIGTGSHENQVGEAVTACAYIKAWADTAAAAAAPVTVVTADMVAG